MEPTGESPESAQPEGAQQAPEIGVGHIEETALPGVKTRETRIADAQHAVRMAIEGKFDLAMNSAIETRGTKEVATEDSPVDQSTPGPNGEMADSARATIKAIYPESSDIPEVGKAA